MKRSCVASGNGGFHSTYYEERRNCRVSLSQALNLWHQYTSDQRLVYSQYACTDIFLSDLCHRRQWPEPLYASFRTRTGFVCVARVNNREYQTDTAFESDRLARENAAMRAYLICQNFSKSDGMYPSRHKGRGGADVVQGIPIAIGSERRSVYTDDSGSSGSRSGGSSPSSYQSSRSSKDSHSHRLSGASSGSNGSRSSGHRSGRRY